MESLKRFLIGFFMALQIGIVGLPNVGKSTLFNALLKAKKANVANYPFCTIDPNVGVVEVPDSRLQKLAELVSPQKIIPATVEFLDIAGLVRGASVGEGLGNQFLASIRECHAVLEVVRLFEDKNVSHVHETIDPKRDIEIIETELILADLQTIEKRYAAKSGEKEKKLFFELMQRVKQTLESGGMAIAAGLSLEEREKLSELHLLTFKPILRIANVSEKDIVKLTPEILREKLGLGDRARIIPISAKIEEEIGYLPEEEASSFLQALGLKEPGLNALIRAAYEILGYITFFTAGPKEVRAWTITKGTKAPQAASVIHSDFEKGFIAAEVIAYEDYIACGGEGGSKEKGKLRIEGRNYVVEDGDVIHFRFNI